VLKANICEGFAAVSSQIEGLIREIKNDITFYKQVIEALGNNDKNKILLGKLTSSIKFYFDDIQKLLEYSLSHCKQIAVDEGLECVTNSMCRSHPFKTCDKTDCKCYQCKEDSDCKHQAYRKFCRSNMQGILVCGDPHVSQSIKGTGEKLCYDFIGQPGQSYLFLQENGLEVTSKFISIPGDNDIPGKLTEYVDELTIRQDGVKISITPTLITAMQPLGPTLILDWLGGAKTRTHMTQLGKIDLTGKQCNINLKNGKTMINGQEMYNGEIRINIVRKGMARGRPFLNFGITDITGLPPDAKGIMGCLSNEVVFDIKSAQPRLDPQNNQHNQHNMDSILQRYNQHNVSTITWSGRTFSVHRDKKSCWKIDEKSLQQFNSILQKFLIHDDQ
ncbi:unnamed protein product, partial [Owenia fusiformis]